MNKSWIIISYCRGFFGKYKLNNYEILTCFVCVNSNISYSYLCDDYVLNDLLQLPVWWLCPQWQRVWGPQGVEECPQCHRHPVLHRRRIPRKEAPPILLPHSSYLPVSTTDHWNRASGDGRGGGLFSILWTLSSIIPRNISHFTRKIQF